MQASRIKRITNSIQNAVKTQSTVTIAKENASNVSLHVTGVHSDEEFNSGHGKNESACTLAQVPYTQMLPEIAM